MKDSTKQENRNDGHDLPRDADDDATTATATSASCQLHGSRSGSNPGHPALAGDTGADEDTVDQNEEGYDTCEEIDKCGTQEGNGDEPKERTQQWEQAYGPGGEDRRGDAGASPDDGEDRRGGAGASPGGDSESEAEQGSCFSGILGMLEVAEDDTLDSAPSGILERLRGYEPKTQEMVKERSARMAEIWKLEACSAVATRATFAADAAPALARS